MRLRSIGAAALAALALPLLAGGCAQTDHNADFYDRWTESMSLNGRFRTDFTPPDAPYDALDLVANFEMVVFEPEENLEKYYRGRPDAPRRLSKWRTPIRYQIVSDQARREDVAAIETVAAQLSRWSGLDIDQADAGPSNLTIFVLSPDARRELRDFEKDEPDYEGTILSDWLEQLNPPCFALFDAGGPHGGEIRDGAIFVKAELHPDLRRACFVEEFAQSLGLLFDHDEVRPSIFNDDQEFVALTRHDAALLQILYDQRLKPGMTRLEAAPIVRAVVAELGSGI